MNSVRFNAATREVEIAGSECFIESNFRIISDLLGKGTGAGQEIGDKGSDACGEKALRSAAVGPGIPETGAVSPTVNPTSSVAPAEQTCTDLPQRPMVKRAPVRKYFNTFGKLIRSEDTAVSKNPPIKETNRTPAGISVGSLKEKFGLSREKIEEIIRDAERQGKVRRDLNGSYEWV